MKQITPKWNGTISKGKFIPADVVSYFSALQFLEGKQVTVVIEPIKKARTTPQNRYYWGVVIAIIADITGNDADTIHHEMRRRYLRDSQNGCMTETEIPKIKSTTELSTAEFSEYIETIKRDAACCAFSGEPIYIPDANEVYQ